MAKVKTKLADRSVLRRVQDATIQHQVYLQRLAESYANELLAIMDSSDRETADYLLKRLSRFGEVSPGVRTAAKFKQVEREIREIRERAFDEAEAQLVMQSISLGKHESTFSAGGLRAMATAAAVKEIPAKAVESIAKYGSFAGHPIASWFEGIQQQDLRNIMSKVRLGVSQGSTTEQIVRSIRGTKEADYQDGILSVSKRSIRTVTRTVTNGMANDIRRQTYEDNADVIDKLVFLATLDSRTSPICMALDGTAWKAGDPGVKWPPLHPNCRSTIIATAKGFGLTGDRPAKNDDGSIEQIPANMTYADWFATQSDTFQEDVLGATRFALYKKGELELGKFVDFNANKPFTLSELERMDRSSFERAGLPLKELESGYGKIKDETAPENTTITIYGDDKDFFPKEDGYETLRDIHNAALESAQSARNYLKTQAQAQGVEYAAIYDKDGKLFSVSKGGPTAVHMRIPLGTSKIKHTGLEESKLACARSSFDLEELRAAIKRAEAFFAANGIVIKEEEE